jgi:4-amino-4-deoxy-L-arabinose transferase-like glycosyltransferase
MKDIFDKISINQKTFIAVILIIITAVCILFINLQKAPIERWDEYTNITVVQESEGILLKYQNNNFFEKPPLWYWINIFANNLVNNNLILYRSISAISGLMISLIIFLYLKNKTTIILAIFGSLGFLATTQNIVVNQIYFSSHTYRTADLDALQILLIFIASIIFTRNPKWYILSTGILALAFMTKGPLAIIFLAINSIIYLYSYGINKHNIKIILIGLSVFVTIVLPWHLYMIKLFGNEFLDNYMVYHMVNRTLTTLEGHNQAWYYYFQVFFDIRVNAFGLFLFFLFNKFRFRLHQLPTYANKFIIYILIFLTILTLMQTKLAWYLLPIYPFMHILIVLFLHKLELTTYTYLYYLLVVLGLVYNFIYVFNL